MSNVVLATTLNSGEASTLNAIGGSKDVPGYLVGAQETNGAGTASTVTGENAAVDLQQPEPEK